MNLGQADYPMQVVYNHGSIQKIKLRLTLQRLCNTRKDFRVVGAEDSGDGLKRSDEVLDGVQH